jgi:hypothetical protein
MLLRYFYEDGGHQAALPVRVVEDSPDRLALWLSEGTNIMYWATQDGRDPRRLPVEQRFIEPLSTARRKWAGPGVLRLLLPDMPYQVLHFWDSDSNFVCWYINFEAPFCRRGSRVDTVDWHLDLVVGPDGSGTWKDEDEAECAVAAGQLAPERLIEARAMGDEIQRNFSAFLERVGDWRDFRPPNDWAELDLPADWAH